MKRSKQHVNTTRIQPERALQHLDVVSSRISGGDEYFDEQRKQAIDLSKEAINHCMIAADVEVIKCDEHAHYKCPHCGKIHLTKWTTRPFASLGEQVLFCNKCGKKLKWENAFK